MSHEYVSKYELEKQRRQEIDNQRVRMNTENYYNRYRAIYYDIISQHLDAFIPDEVAKLKADLATIEAQLAYNPFAARDISMAVQGYIYGLMSLGRSAKSKFEAEERARIRAVEEAERKQRELEAKMQSEKIAEMSKEYFSVIHSIKNPAIQNFAAADLNVLREELNKGVVKDREDLKSRLNKIVSSATEKAEEWRRNAIEEAKTEALAAQLNDMKNIVTEQKIEDADKKQEIIRTIEDLKKTTASTEEIIRKIEEVQKQVDDVLISEDVRREAVKAIYKQLKSQNFTVASPELVNDGNEDYVRIIAKMPSGKRAVCNLTSKGELIYKFDKYEGMTCLKDIEKFNVDLKNIYSVKLSDERVIWTNPDEIGKDADKLPTSHLSIKGN